MQQGAPLRARISLLRRGLWLVCAALALAASPSFAAQPARQAAPPLVLQAGATLGQTFIAHHDGLDALEIFLEPLAPGDGEIYLALRDEPGAQADRATAQLPVSAVSSPAFYRFAFERQEQSRQKRLYLQLELRGDGQVGVGSGPGHAYLDGAAYRDDAPLDGQLLFQPAYAPQALLLDAAGRALAWLLVVLVSFALFVLPGWGLLTLARAELGRLSAWATLSIAAGVGLALHPLLLLLSGLVGLRLGPLYAWLPTLAGGALVLWRHRHWRPARPTGLRRWAVAAAPELTLAGLVGLLLVGRLAAVEALVAPMWGDSVQHTVMTQLFLDHGGLFNSWQPYTPYQSLTVQFGFPLHVALYAWMTGASSVEATIVVGQVINALAVLTLYPLAVHVAGGSRWAGAAAVLVAGLLMPMPGFYTNWGRYAQLDGQAILPAALLLIWLALERERLAWRLALLGGAVVAGMTLTYYRMPFYFAPFLLALLLVWGLPRWRLDGRRWLRAGGVGALAGLATLLLFLPWALHVRESALAQSFGSGEVQGTPLQNVLADYANWRAVTVYLPPGLLALSLLGLAWSLVRRRWPVAAVGLWIALLSSIVAGRLIKLPGANLMQNFAIVIALYIPAALVVGWLAAELIGALERRRPRAAGLAGAAALLGLGLWGAGGQQRVVDPFYAIVTRPDVAAMDWIRANTSPDARFLVEGFQIWGGTSAVGADAGWWLPLLAGRANTMPPQYAMLNEAPSPPDYTRRVVELVGQLEQVPLTSPEALSSLCDWGITHVYVGQGQGRVGFGVTQLFAPEELIGNPAFEQLYHQDRVYVFALDQGQCVGRP